MVIIAEKTVAGGAALGRIGGKAVFVPYLLPGETAEIEIVEDRRDYSRGRIVTLLEKSPRRVTPPCPLFGQCGGCSLQMADGNYQAELRAAVFADSLRRAGSSFEGKISLVTGEFWGYRSRAQFHRSPDGSPGFSAARSGEIVTVHDCHVLVEGLRDALLDGTITRAMAGLESNGGASDAGGRSPSRRGSSSRRGSRTPRDREDQIRFHAFYSAGRLFHEGTLPRAVAAVGGRELAFDVRGFFQSNLPLLELLLEAVTGDIKSGTSLLDFYAGVGTFSAFAAPAISRSVLVEHNGGALEYARENVALPREALELCAVPDGQWPSHPAASGSFDLAVVDPPRQGIAREALQWFISSRIPEIRYVSCDPVTFARDAALLEAGGFTLSEASLYDFYPQTHHAEVYGRFIR